MRFCPECGYSNADAFATCQRCGKKLVNFTSATPPPVPAKAAPPIRFSVVAGSIWIGALLLLGVAYTYEWSRYQKEEARLAAELSELKNSHEEERRAAELAEQQRVQTEEAAHQERMHDEALLSGTKARERHAREWQSRLAHDNALAGSALEKNLLEMERIGNDPLTAAQVALEKVARMASPPGSRVEVANSGSGFVLRVAFKMSEVSPNEKGAVTKHHSTASMRREIEELSARLVKEVFDYCGSRHIERLSLSCNHAISRGLIPSGATESERQELLRRAGVVMGSLYRISVDAANAGTVANWREISVPKVIRFMHVDYDGLNKLDIRGFAAERGQEDPNMPLEF